MSQPSKYLTPREQADVPQSTYAGGLGMTGAVPPKREGQYWALVPKIKMSENMCMCVCEVAV
jgi:hypothetical protein